jgi:hypothetical protein
VEEYPFCAVGLIIGHRDLKDVNSNKIGTGFLIDHQLVLTVAHNLWDRQKNKFYENIRFVPSPLVRPLNPLKNIRRGFKVKDIFVSKQFKHSKYSAFAPMVDSVL